MRADRLLTTLLLLQVNESITARELAERLEISERTVYRDMEALSMAGIPVIGERGNGGGWALLESYRTRVMGLNTDEIQALFVSTPPRVLADLGLEQAAEGALLKVMAALPTMARLNADFVRERIYVDAAGWGKSTEPVPNLPILQEALWREKQVKLVYQRGECDDVERVGHPLGLVAKGTAWYLVAQVDGEIRTYRASRILEATVLEERAERPHDFDLAAYWQQSMTEFRAKLPRYPATVRMTPNGLNWARMMWRYARVEQAHPPDESGWHLVEATFETLEDAAQNVLSLGPDIQVITPEELRTEVYERTRATLALYEHCHENKLGG
jgi:predicted DNA-binding transcriptional regulator YafY